MSRLFDLSNLSNSKVTGDVRRYAGVKKFAELVPLAQAEGAKLGKAAKYADGSPMSRDDKMMRNAFIYFAEKHNAEVLEAREIKKEKLAAELSKKRKAATVARKVASTRGVQQKSKNAGIISQNGKVKTYVQPEINANKITKTVIDRVNAFEKVMCTVQGNKTREDLYKSIMQIVEESGSTRYISVAYEDGRGHARLVSLKAGQLLSYADFEKKLQDIESNDSLGGSDRGAIDLDDNKLVLDRFFVSSYTMNLGAKSADMIYETNGIVSDGFCAWESMKAIGVNDGLRRKMDLSELLKYIDDSKKPVGIINNAVNLMNPHFKIFKSRPHTIQMVAKGKRVESYPLVPLFQEDIKTPKPRYVNLRKPTDEDHQLATERSGFESPHEVEHAKELNKILKEGVPILIIDLVNNHVDVVKSLTLLPIMLAPSGDIFKDGRLILTPTHNYKNLEIQTECKQHYVFFDYETVIDFEQSSCMRPYSLCIFCCNGAQLSQLNVADQDGNVQGVEYIKAGLYDDGRSGVENTGTKTFLGADCGEQFLEWIVKTQENRQYTFIGFNNSNFDNLLLMNTMLKDTKDLNVSDIFIAGNAVMNFTLNGRHKTFDLHRHLVGSLASNCNSFKVKCCAKKSFDHAIPQQHYLNGTLDAWINGNTELKEYNEYDVLATAVLYQRYACALKEIPALKDYNLLESGTVGSLIYKVFSEHNKKVNLPKLSLDQYQRVLKYKAAGRVEMFNGIQKLDERLASNDVCSLYPYVMSIAPVHYPCGEIVEVTEYIDGMIGFYRCDIDQTSLRARNLPLIHPKKTETENQWDFDGILYDYTISNVMIELLRKHNCPVTVHSGFVFTDKIKSCNIFGFLLDFMGAKNEQDTFDATQNPKYNAALRNTIKLLSNAVSGKVIEGLHAEKTAALSDPLKYAELLETAASVNMVSAVGQKLFVTYTSKEEDLISQQRPVYLGVLIYDYARTHMYNHSYSQIGLDKLLYTDTDATKCRYTDAVEWHKYATKTIVPHWPEIEAVDPRYKTHPLYSPDSKVYGSFEDELGEMVGSNYKFYCLQKKSWAYHCDTLVTIGSKLSKKHAVGAIVPESKFRFKGVNPSAQLLTKPLAESQKDRHLFYESNKGNSISSNPMAFFEQIHNTGSARVLAVNFRRIIKNSRRNVKLDDVEKYNTLMSSIQVNYIEKVLKIVK
jgi:hypothetical protein